MTDASRPLPSSDPPRPWWTRTWAVGLLLVGLCAATYAPVGRYGFVVVDDPANISAEPHVLAGPSAAGVRWAATAFLMGHWVPLTRLTYLLDRWWVGLAPGPMHLEDLALHAATCVVLFGFLAEATGAAGRAAAVAALFAVHPTHVESVVWLTERRDVLSTPLLLGSLWAYVRHARGGGRAAYAVALGLYAASLTAKAMGMTAPVLMLLLDAWPLARVPRRGRAGWRPLLVEKVPFGGLAGAAAVLALHAQRASGAASSLGAVPVPARIANGLVTAVLYAVETAFPRHLAIMYLPPALGWPPGEVLAAAVGLSAAAMLAVWYRRRVPAVAFGLAWFAVALLPVSGIAQSGPQAMADRYTYVPTIGLLLAAVWAVADARPRSVPAWTRPAAAALAVAALAVTCRAQVGYWRTDQALLQHAADVTEENWWVDYNLGLSDAARGDYGRAADRFARSLRANPADAQTWDDLANCVFEVDPARAIPIYREAIRRAPRDARVHANLGNALLAVGRPAEAVAELERSAQLDPSDYARRRVANARRREAAAGR